MMRAQTPDLKGYRSLIYQERPIREADRHLFSPPFGTPARRLVIERWQVSWLTDHR